MTNRFRRCAPRRIALWLVAGLAGGPAVAAAASGSPTGPHVFGTVALAVGETRYDHRWQRVMADGASTELDRLIRDAAPGSRRQQLFQVQAAVNRTIAFRADRDAHGRGDHWSTAGETLSSRTGDCEDVAILKLQALRRLGFDADDLYLSIGRDKGRGDHALALVRLDGEYWVLDNLGSAPAPAESHHYFEPVFTLAEGGAWLHGRRRATASGGHAAVRVR